MRHDLREYDSPSFLEVHIECRAPLAENRFLAPRYGSAFIRGGCNVPHLLADEGQPSAIADGSTAVVQVRKTWKPAVAADHPSDSLERGREN